MILLIEEYKLKRTLNLIKNIFIRIRKNYLYLDNETYQLVNDPIFRIYVSGFDFMYDASANDTLPDSFYYHNAILVSCHRNLDIGLIKDINEERIKYFHDI